MNSPHLKQGDKQKKVEDTLTLDDIVQVVKQLPKPENILERIVLCKKHWKALEKETVFKENSNPIWGSLSGVCVVIKPYIKKARLYYKSL